MAKKEKHIVVTESTHKRFKDIADNEGRKHDFLMKDMIDAYEKQKMKDK